MSFPLQPILKGTLVTLRPLRWTDFETLYTVASDPLVWEQHPQPNRYQRPVFEEYFKTGMESKGAFVIIENQTQRLVGSSRFYQYNSNKSEVEIGYTFLARSCWGGEFNREIKFLMLSHAFQYVDTVFFHAGENNHRSRRALEKIGAVLVDRAPGLYGTNIKYKLTR